MKMRAACHVQGQFQFRFSLVYTSLEEVLPAIEELCILAQQDGTKEQRAAAKERLGEIIQVQPSSRKEAYFHAYFHWGWRTVTSRT
jgi:hypothetical protein